MRSSLLRMDVELGGMKLHWCEATDWDKARFRQMQVLLFCRSKIIVFTYLY